MLPAGPAACADVAAPCWLPGALRPSMSLVGMNCQATMLQPLVLIGALPWRALAAQRAGLHRRRPRPAPRPRHGPEGNPGLPGAATLDCPSGAPSKACRTLLLRTRPCVLFSSLDMQPRIGLTLRPPRMHACCMHLTRHQSCCLGPFGCLAQGGRCVTLVCTLQVQRGRAAKDALHGRLIAPRCQRELGTRQRGLLGTPEVDRSKGAGEGLGSCSATTSGGIVGMSLGRASSGGIQGHAPAQNIFV